MRTAPPVGDTEYMMTVALAPPVSTLIPPNTRLAQTVSALSLDTEGPERFPGTVATLDDRPAINT